MKKLKNNTAGFSLTEVLIGMMILSVAIVTGTNLLIGLIDSNKNVVMTMQAHYFAQEGIEAVRNVRDSNWLHNENWLGGSRGEKIWDDVFKVDNDYAVNLNDEGWKIFPTLTQKGKNREVVLGEMSAGAPWKIVAGELDENLGRIYKYEDGDDAYYSSLALPQGEDSGFRRIVMLKSYEDCPETCVLVHSEVLWEEGNKERSVALEAVLTDWKGGVL